jgi:ketosteroid isomerase-like protein
MPAEENVELARRSFAAWNEGGVEASRAAGWTEDAEWHDPPDFPDAGVHRGADAVAARLGELRGLLPHDVEVLDAVAAGEDEVLITVMLHGEGSSSGTPIEQQMGCVMQLRDGKVSRWRIFMSHEEARAAAGVSS